MCVQKEWRRALSTIIIITFIQTSSHAPTHLHKKKSITLLVTSAMNLHTIMQEISMLGSLTRAEIMECIFFWMKIIHHKNAYSRCHCTYRFSVPRYFFRNNFKFLRGQDSWPKFGFGLDVNGFTYFPFL